MQYFFHLAGKLSRGAHWKHGKVRVVLASDFRDLYRKHEYSYLRGVYPDVIDLLHDPLPLEGSKRHYFSDLTIRDKLIIVAHGTSRGIMDLKEDKLAWWLSQAGLREVGVIKFHSCYTGYGIWLYHMREQLNHHHIRFSYLCGPNGRYVYQCFPFRYGERGYKIISGNVPQDFQRTRYLSKNVDG